MAARTFDFNAEDDLSKWLKALEGNEGPREIKAGECFDFSFKPVAPSIKYVFSKGSNGVFHGNKYIGQGKLTGSTLIVNPHKSVTVENFALSHITNLN